MDETWVESPSFTSVSVSDLGRVRSKTRVLKPFFSRKCWCVAIWNGKRSGNRSVAALVAEAFLGMPPLLEAAKTRKIIHLNGDRSDCRVANLLVLPLRKHSSLDYLRAQALRSDGVPLGMIEKLTNIPRCSLKRRTTRKSTA